MYAIIETGGKQYRVEKDDIIDIELTSAAEDKKVEFKQVLFLSDGEKISVGTPTVANCTVIGQVEQEVKGPKVISFHYRRRKDSKKKVGHRQKYLRVKITDIKID